MFWSKLIKRGRWRCSIHFKIRETSTWLWSFFPAAIWWHYWFTKRSLVKTWLSFTLPKPHKPSNRSIVWVLFIEISNPTTFFSMQKWVSSYHDQRIILSLLVCLGSHQAIGFWPLYGFEESSSDWILSGYSKHATTRFQYVWFTLISLSNTLPSPSRDTDRFQTTSGNLEEKSTSIGEQIFLSINVWPFPKAFSFLRLGLFHRGNTRLHCSWSIQAMRLQQCSWLVFIDDWSVFRL